MSGKYKELDREMQGVLFIGGIPAVDLERSETSAVQGRISGPVRSYGFDATALFFAKMETVRLRARAAVKDALKRGLLVRPSACERCGDPGKPQSHHYDYARPLDVRWYCPRCHKAETRRIADLARASLPNGIHTPGFKGTPLWAIQAIRKGQRRTA